MTHSKGKRLQHKYISIPLCTECMYQHASRVCCSCSASKGLPCFLCDGCYDNHSCLNDSEKMSLYTWVVSSCLECKKFSARVRCLTCKEPFCAPCFDKMHSRGNRLYHDYIVLPHWGNNMDNSFTSWMQWRESLEMLHTEDVFNRHLLSKQSERVLTETDK